MTKINSEMHIGYVVEGFPPYGKGGGIVSYVAEIAQALRRQGHKIVIFSMLGEDNYHESYIHDGIPVYTVACARHDRFMPQLAVIENVRRLARSVKEYQTGNKLDVLEVPEIGAYGLFIDTEKVRLVARLHSGSMELARNRGFGWDPRIRIIHGLEKRAVKRAHKVTALTRFQSEKAWRLYSLDASRLSVIPNFIKILPSSLVGEELRTIGFFGRLDRLKGVPCLCNAFNKVSSKYPRVSLVMAGRDTLERFGFTKSSVQDYCQKLLLDPDRVRFTGQLSREETFGGMKRSLFVVLPSIYEAFPMVLLEAMQLGKAVISTRVCGIPEIVEDGRSGILVKPNDAAGLADAMVKLLENPELTAQMGAEGRKIVEKRFSEHIVIPQFIETYRRVIALNNTENY
jgi:glycosyltransferase involved in cell wall biosynthesis